MKRPILNLLIAAAGFVVMGTASSCMINCIHGSGHQATENRKVTQDFTKLEVSGGFKVILKQDSSGTISLTADDNVLKYIKTKNEDGTLQGFTHKNICDSGAMT